MRAGTIAAALAVSISGALPAWAELVYVWRPSEGLNGGKVLPEDAFTVSTPPVDEGVDFRSQDFGQFPQHYTTRTVALAVGDLLSVPVPSVFGFNGCRVLADESGYRPDAWVSVSNSGAAGKYNVVIQAKVVGRLELTVRCVTNTASETQTLWDEYLNLTISET